MSRILEKCYIEEVYRRWSKQQAIESMCQDYKLNDRCFILAAAVSLIISNQSKIDCKHLNLSNMRACACD